MTFEDDFAQCLSKSGIEIEPESVPTRVRVVIVDRRSRSRERRALTVQLFREIDAGSRILALRRMSKRSKFCSNGLPSGGDNA